MAKRPKKSTKKHSIKPEDVPYSKPKKAVEPFWKTNLIPALIIFILPFALYISTLGFEYVLDDKIVIVDNQYTKKGFAGIKEIFTTESFQGYFGEQKNLLEGGRYRPLSIATFAVEYEFFWPQFEGWSFDQYFALCVKWIVAFSSSSDDNSSSEK